MRKCNVCKVPVPPKTKVCPVCGKEYSRLQYFRMNYLGRTIIILLAALFLYNCIVIIMFNRKIKNYVGKEDYSVKQAVELKQEYNKLSSFQKKFVHISEIEGYAEVKHTVDVTHGDTSVEIAINFQNGSVKGEYRGELRDDAPDGIGEFYFVNEDGVYCTYEGEFSKGKIDGFGEMRYASGEVYKGKFIDGRLTGVGKKYGADGNVDYRGYFAADVFSGNGILYGDNGNVVFEGTFVTGLPEKNAYFELCERVSKDEVLNNPEGLVGRNICCDAMLTDISVLPDWTQQYTFSVANSEHNSFSVVNKGAKIDMVPGNNYIIYGYCNGIGEDKIVNTDAYYITRLN